MVLEAYRYHTRGFKIYANLALSFPYELYDAQMIESFASDQNPLKNAVVLVDEAHVLLDSRSSFTKRNKIISYFILQTRKRNVHLLYTTQSFHQIEKRLRDQSDYLVECSYDKEHDYIRHRIEETSSGKVMKHMIDATPIFDLYDTNAIIDPFADKKVSE